MIGTGRIKQPSFGMRHCGLISTNDYVKSSRVKFRSVGRKRRLQWRIDSLIVELLAFAQPGLERQVNNGFYYVQPLD
jgi:hypothetical protein